MRFHPAIAALFLFAASLLLVADACGQIMRKSDPFEIRIDRSEWIREGTYIALTTDSLALMVDVYRDPLIQRELLDVFDGQTGVPLQSFLKLNKVTCFYGTPFSTAFVPRDRSCDTFNALMRWKPVARNPPEESKPLDGY